MMIVPDNVLSSLPSFGLILVGTIVAFGIFAALLAVIRRSAGPKIERKPFLTRAEIEVLDYLRRALLEHHVSCQVSMGALLKPRQGLSPKEFWRTRNLILPGFFRGSPAVCVD